jgi:hypothetical protein
VLCIQLGQTCPRHVMQGCTPDFVSPPSLAKFKILPALPLSSDARHFSIPFTITNLCMQMQVKKCCSLTNYDWPIINPFIPLVPECGSIQRTNMSKEATIPFPHALHWCQHHCRQLLFVFLTSWLS